MTQMLSSLSTADGVGEGPGVEVVADLAKVFAVGVELEELGGGRPVGRAGRSCRA